MYGLIVIFILFGLTGKSNVPIEEIWSENSANYASFASITLARERFQLIVKNICFDNIYLIKCPKYLTSLKIT